MRAAATQFNLARKLLESRGATMCFLQIIKQPTYVSNGYVLSKYIPVNVFLTCWLKLGRVRYICQIVIWVEKSKSNLKPLLCSSRVPLPVRPNPAPTTIHHTFTWTTPTVINGPAVFCSISCWIPTYLLYLVGIPKHQICRKDLFLSYIDLETNNSFSDRMLETMHHVVHYTNE